MQTLIYVLKCRTTGEHKIGITSNWQRRSRELKVGLRTDKVHVARVPDARALEHRLHRQYEAVNKPQTEWFNLSETQLAEVLNAINAAAAEQASAHDALATYQKTAALTQGNRKQPANPQWTASTGSRGWTGARTSTTGCHIAPYPKAMKSKIEFGDVVGYCIAFIAGSALVVAMVAHYPWLLGVAFFVFIAAQLSKS